MIALGTNRSDLVARDFDLDEISVTCSVCRLHDRCRGALQERVVTWGIGDGENFGKRSIDLVSFVN